MVEQSIAKSLRHKKDFFINHIVNMKFLFDPKEGRKQDEYEEQPMSSVDKSHHDIAEGSEFLDDGIRTKDQPFKFTEEDLAPESPQNQ